MQVNVEDCLARVLVAVEDKTVSRFGNLEFFRKCLGDQNQPSDQQGSFSGNIVNPFDMLLGNNNHMDRCLGSNVIKGNYIVVFIQDCATNFTGNNFAENALSILLHDALPSDSRLGFFRGL